jgi:hypothetical protein
VSVAITSRYRPLGVVAAPDAQGVLQPTLPIRRPEPAPGADRPAYQHRVTGVEDIEYIAWSFYGASDVWWRIADANPVRFPLDLRPGDALAIPSNEDFGLIVSRERRFT